MWCRPPRDFIQFRTLLIHKLPHHIKPLSIARLTQLQQLPLPMPDTQPVIVMFGMLLGLIIRQQ